ncbi:MAG: B12-binding domain-containing radical SAM protein, partial [Elusimicrobia bacterium]|nr:B12-binding domain-containing radical SAM protein [Elusimicrobiota bacterium]
MGPTKTQELTMDLLLTHAYFIGEDSLEKRHIKPYPPLGILYISSHLKRKEFDIAVFDTTFKTKKEFAQYLDQHKPPMIGLYVNLMTKKSALEMMRLTRDRQIKIILGGPDPANYLDEYLNAGADAIVLGEGELTLEQLIPALKTNAPLRDIPGLAFKTDDGTIIRTTARPLIKPLDGQPFPDREAIDLSPYKEAWQKRHGLSSLSLITARGCSFTCRWCSHSVFGLTHRRRSPEDVAAELEETLQRYHPDMIWYADDVFTMSRPWVARYAQQLAERNIEIPFETITRADCLDEATVEHLGRMGCRKIWIGSE